MKIKQKIPAFTLMEVTITMLIAAVAISITYTAYRIISGTYLNYSKKQDRIAAFTLADRLLKKDFLSADHILKTTEGLNFQSSGGIISYLFRDSCLMRSQHALQTDTFKIPVTAASFTFEHAAAADDTMVDQLEYETQLEGQPTILTYRKLYSSQNLFK